MTYTKIIYRFSDPPRVLSSDIKFDEIKSLRKQAQRGFMEVLDKIEKAPRPSDGESLILTKKTFWAANAVSLFAKDEVHESLLKHDDVVFSHFNYIYYLPELMASSVTDTKECNMPLPESWPKEKVYYNKALENKHADGSGIKVGVLDTGVDGSHPLLKGKTADFSIATCEEGGQETVKIAEQETAIEPKGGSHGTHISGLICADKIGFAPNAKLAVCAAFNEIAFTSTWEKITAGVEWLIGKGIHVLNLSLGGGQTTMQELNEVLLTAISQNIIVFVAAGNAGHLGRGNVLYPGTVEALITLGAYNIDEEIYSRSSYNGFSKPDLVLPGECVASTLPIFESMPNRIGIKSGTSQATAIASGIGALVKNLCPTITHSELKNLIVKSCTKLPKIDPDKQGAGALSMERLFQALPR